MIRKLRKGFTIVELVIVIAVIAVLTAVLVPTFVHLSKKAKHVNDTSLVANLNTALEIDKGEGHAAPQTMQDAVDAVKRQGYLVPQLVTKSDEELVYSIEQNKFLLSNEVAEGEEYKYWHIEKGGMPESQKYSIYAFEWGDVTAASNLKVGFDAGEETKIASVSYDRSGESTIRNVVIRTNSSSTSLSVKGYVDSSDNTKGDTVKHYGVAGDLNVIKCAVGSYHENGKVAFAEISSGRIVLEQKSEIKHIHVNSNETATGFDAVYIKDNGAAALPKAITRDEVTVTEATTVVTVESKDGTEEVKVYADGSQGTTQKTETQNTGVTSALGQLVLDNGSESKALSEDLQEAEKTTLIEEAVTEEVAEEMAEEDFSMFEARIGKKGYYSLRAALEAASAGDSVVLLKDADLVTEYGITKSLTIYGSGHTVRASTATAGYGSNREGRVFDISDTSGLNVSFVNIKVQGEATGVRGISLYGNTNLNLTLSDCSVSSNYYAINVASANTNLHVTLKNNTFSTGYCAIQSWSPSAVFDILGGTLEGNNDKTYNAEGWNDFSTIVLNSAATNNTWNFKNVTIKASSTTGNKETLFSNRTTGSIVSFENCTFVSNDVELTELQDIVNNCHFSAHPSSMKINGTELIRQADAYYTNAGAVFANGDITSASPSDELNTYFEYPFVQGWLASGEGVKLLSDVELSSNITLQLTEGSIYLIFNGHTISGGKIVLQGTASVISEVGTMSGVFEGSVSVTDNGNGSFTYSLAA